MDKICLCADSCGLGPAPNLWTWLGEELNLWEVGHLGDAIFNDTPELLGDAKLVRGDEASTVQELLGDAKFFNPRDPLLTADRKVGDAIGDLPDALGDKKASTFLKPELRGDATLAGAELNLCTAPAL
mmetsp:Transcript_70599/g.110479  ORF Transcript_70599/g.110479 Transcript_70599/m.110479 type:complete len:128 (-) Transcript_70599:605-988(-)